jgi:hypothetical protein
VSGDHPEVDGETVHDVASDVDELHSEDQLTDKKFATY